LLRVALALTVVVAAGCGSAARVRTGAPPSRPSSAPTTPVPTSTSPTSASPIAAPPTTTAPGVPTVNLSGQGTAPPAVAPPTAISIPAIGVTSSIVDLGRNANGTIEVPSTTTVVGWYDEGSAPGQVGPAVFLGHIDSYLGPGIFYHLKDLVPGNDVVVTSGTEERTFLVTRVSTYPKDAFPTSAVYAPVPDAELRLITCGGAFDSSTGHYVDNVVVFAVAAS
jgi:hypothetical protein